ncbi:tubby C-terminal domain-like protein [Shouchella xiaoxiensis]|uniref:tubby C-terminal domain-like protein n=1 Tax=Shouchella xiaoxiensis TaxID=766895 RepID=UPI003F5ABAF4
MPLYRYSTKRISVLQPDEKEAGTMRRFYRTRMERVVDAFLKIANKKNYIATINGKEKSYSATYFSFKNSLWRDKWYIYPTGTLEGQPCGHFINTSKVTTNPCFLYEKGNKAYLFRSDLLDKKTYIENKQKQVIAIIFFKSFTTARNTYISIKKEELESSEVLLLTHIYTTNTE